MITKTPQDCGFYMPWSIPMNSDKLKGGLKEAKGKVEKAAGELTGDDKKKDKGTADKVAGAIQKGIGEAKDVLKKVTK